jgi:single-stranded-DNA-specific exonuclease
VAAAASTAFLGIEHSLGGRRWQARLDDERVGLALAQRLGLPEIVGQVLAARGVALDEADAFLTPTLRHYLPDPSSLRDMDRAADRLARAILDGESVAVFGDYDVDGATSSALLHGFFKAVGAPLRIYIPDRMKEGYGPNAPALRRLRDEGVKIVVTVDCGISAHDALTAAAEAGLEIVVVDHHVAEPRLPPAFAVINPNRLDENGALGHLAAVGVAFLLIVALNRRLRDLGAYGTARPEPDLRRWLDLVALGTVCDSVPLHGLNRAFVAQGLKVMAARGNVGLAALADVANLRSAPAAFHAGFLLGPRVNAGGRVGEAPLGAQLLTTDDPDEARRIAGRLDAYNQERRAIEATVTEEALAQQERRLAAGTLPLLVVAAAEGWHPGVIGIVASRLVERFHRPVFVVALAEGMGKGSGRSIAGVDLGSAVIAARQAGLLINGGGHKMAAGITVAADRLAELEAFLLDHVGRQLAGAVPQPTLGIDGGMAVGAAKPELMALIAQIGPFGMGNAEPRFAFPAARIAKADVVGEDHVRCFLTDAGGARLKAIAFRAVGTPLGQALLQARGGVLHLAGHLRADEWRGQNEVQLVIEDGAPV